MERGGGVIPMIRSVLHSATIAGKKNKIIDKQNGRLPKEVTC